MSEDAKSPHGRFWPFGVEVNVKPKKSMKTAVVFGSGGARGWAHIGVLKAFREVGFRPDMVAGTSIGAVAAAVYAADALDAFIAFSKELDWFKAAQLFVEFGVHRSGLIEGRKVSDFLESMIPAKRIDEFPLPFAAIATNLVTSEEVVFRNGPLMPALRASISIPGIFTPVKIGGHYLVDGGLVNPLPMNAVRAMGATHVIAVNINNNLALEKRLGEGRGNPIFGNFSEIFRRQTMRFGIGLDKTENSPSTTREEGDGGLSFERQVPRRKKNDAALDMNLFDVFSRSLRIAEDKITSECIRANPPDVLIEPAVGSIATMDFSRADEAISAGYLAAMATLAEVE